MADNLVVKDASGTSRTVRTTDRAGIHTPHHIVEGEVAIKAGDQPIVVSGEVEIVNPVAISNFPTNGPTEATTTAILDKLANDPATQATVAAILAKLSADPATQTTLAAVLAKISADPASQTTLAAVLAKLSDPASETSLLAVLDRLPAALDVDGRLKVALPVAGAASSVEVTNFPTVGASEATQAAVLAKLAADPATQTTLAAILAKLASDPASQTTLAAVLAKLTSDPATQTGLTNILTKLSNDPATQTSMAQAAAALDIIAGRATADPATQTTLAAILAKLTADPATQTTLAAVLAKLTADPATNAAIAALSAKFPTALDGDGRLRVALPIGGAASIVEVSNFPTDAATEVTLAAVLAKLADLGTQTTLAAVLAKLSADPATQTTLAAVLAKMTADPATQTTLAAVLAKLAADPSTDATLSALSSKFPAVLDAAGRLKVALPDGAANSSVEVTNFPADRATQTTTAAILAKLSADPATQTTLAAILSALVNGIAITGPQTDAQMRAAPVITSGYDPVFDKMVVGTARDKFRDQFFNFDTAAAWEVVQTGAGMTITQDGVLNGSRYLNIAAGNTINSETVILSRTSFQLPVKFAFGLSMSQRVVNQEVYAELVGVDDNGVVEVDATYPAPNLSTARNGAGFKFDSTTATTAQTMVRGYGVSELVGALAGQTTTIATGTSPNFIPAGYYQLEADMEQAYFSSYAIDSLAANLAPLRRTQALPNPMKRYKIRLRVKNLSTAPVGVTNVRFHFIRLMDTTRMSVDFRQPGHSTDVANAVPVVMTQAGPTQPVSGSVTASATLQAGTAVAGSVGVAALTTGSAATSLRIASVAGTNIAVVKASAGKLFGGVLSNTTASAKFAKFYNKATAAVLATDVPVLTIVLQPNATVSMTFAGAIGMAFSAGIGIAITGAIADTDATNTQALDVVGNILFI